MDRELGRLLQAFEARFEDRGCKILVAGDHGEGLGEGGRGACFVIRIALPVMEEAA